MTTLGAVRQGLADAIKAATGLRSYPYGEADQLNPPCAAVFRADTDPRLTFGDVHTHTFFKVQVFVQSNAARSAVETLDGYADHATGIAAAIADEDNWVDDLVHYAQVQSVSAVQVGFLNGQQEQYLMQEFDVEVVW